MTVGVLSFRAQPLLLNVMSFRLIYTATNDGIFSSLITHSPRDIKVDPKSWYCGWKGNKSERAMSVGYTDSFFGVQRTHESAVLNATTTPSLLGTLQAVVDTSYTNSHSY